MVIFPCEWRSRIRVPRGRWCSKSRPLTGGTGQRSSGSLTWVSKRLSVARFQFRSRRSDRGCFASTTSEASCNRTCVSLGLRRCSTSRRCLQRSWSRPGQSIVLVTSARPAARATRRGPGRVQRDGPVRGCGSGPARQLARFVDRLQRTRFRRHFARRPRGPQAGGRAVLKWVHCGGNLIVHRAGKTAKDVLTIERLLDLDENAAVGELDASGWVKSLIAFCDPPTHARTGLRLSRSIARIRTSTGPHS